jgi:hypothetical protein
MKLPHRRQFLHLTVGAAALPVGSGDLARRSQPNVMPSLLREPGDRWKIGAVGDRAENYPTLSALSYIEHPLP